jgi:hypothetical protein
VDQYSLTLSAPGAFTFTVDSDFSEPSLQLYKGSSAQSSGFIAWLTSGGDNDVTLKAFLDATGSGPGRQAAAAAATGYFLRVSDDDSRLGQYTLTPAQADGKLENCETWFSTHDLSTNQDLAATDCQIRVNRTDGTHFFRYADRIWVHFQAGERVSVSQTSATIDTYLMIFNASGQLVASDDDGGQGLNSYLEFTAPATGYYRVYASTFTATPGGVGPYTLVLSSLASAAALGLPEATTLGVEPATLFQGAEPGKVLDEMVETVSGKRGRIR